MLNKSIKRFQNLLEEKKEIFLYVAFILNDFTIKGGEHFLATNYESHSKQRIFL